MSTTTWTEENIGTALSEAMAEGKIVAYFQPKYDTITGRISGAEALSRWLDDDGKPISPAEFIPLLEKSMLIAKLDWYILELTCQFQRRMLNSFLKPVTVSVNFSRMHTYETDFVNKLCEIVDRHHVPHDLIEAEITESALALEGTDIIAFVKNIRDAGFSVAIDDFGSGLSSLSFVKDVPANVLKIDKSLLSDNCENEKERVVLESIFSFAQRLKLFTVAEGVETKEQLGFLRTCGCDVIQGFYFAKPMPEKDYENLLRESLQTTLPDNMLDQPASLMTRMLLKAIFMCYPMIIVGNLTRDSFYVMAYEHFTNHAAPTTGVYHEMVETLTETVHEDDRQRFLQAFDLQGQIAAYSRGERSKQIVVKQKGDDEVYRLTEITSCYMHNISSDDVMVITMMKNL